MSWREILERLNVGAKEDLSARRDMPRSTYSVEPDGILNCCAGTSSTSCSRNLHHPAAAPPVRHLWTAVQKSSTMCTTMAADEGTLEKTNAPSSSTPQQSRGERQRHGSGASDRDQRTVAKKDIFFRGS